MVSGISRQSHDIDASNYESIFRLFKQIITSAGFINMPSSEKVKKLVGRIKWETGLFSLMLRQG